MGIFSTIMSKIFGHADAAPASGSTGSAGAASSGATPSGATSASGGATNAAPPTAPGAPVDVEAVLTRLASGKGQTLNWRTSIVDLLKLLDMDSSLDARKHLAQELHYTESTDDTATMNVWLIRQVMQKLAENGGKVPEDLRH
ncbi:DUF3597 domain-containing protein [Swaminathania salitolerans]|uniref:DUF3597 domain-containing protein n=1 Tax=Swaminathania salitolerans TaxID=182838 RepID=A0A511BPW1_9PROT|nr:DUF3597 domain-containing protein [Swaminathania salitolerans]GBQ11142.1 hypothetical protein AA21291_0704 [Swaminathania salitolerans LMG 21291]GEL02360.1 hypothetical protein SSA02_15230 [Swaminathania salitolerans]